MRELDLVWWEELGSSLRLKKRILNGLKEEKNILLNVQGAYPWRDRLHEFVRENGAALDAEKSVRFLEHTRGADAGEELLQKDCSQEVRDNFWAPSGMNVGQYLCSYPDIALHRHMLWIKGIDDFGELRQWLELISKYCATAEAMALEHRALFVLEYTGGRCESNRYVETIDYKISDMDIRMFCCLSSEEENEDYAAYACELACRLCGGDPYKCAEYMRLESELIINTLNVACRVRPELDRKRALARVLMAQIAVFYPVLEKNRLDIIERNYELIARQMPFDRPYGEPPAHKPEELELAHIAKLINDGKIRLSKPDYDKLYLLRDARNTLAHNNILSFDKCLELWKLK